MVIPLDTKRRDRIARALAYANAAREVEAAMRPATGNEPVCECGHPFLSHCTVHRGGCLGMPEHGCGPDCQDECMAEKCDCRQYDPRWAEGGEEGGEPDQFPDLSASTAQESNQRAREILAGGRP